MIHQLKTIAPFFEDIAKGAKTFEVRKNDRDYKVGDYLALNEYETNKGCSGRCMLVRVTYLLQSNDYCKDGFCVMGIEPCGIRCATDDFRKEPDRITRYGCVVYGEDKRR